MQYRGFPLIFTKLQVLTLALKIIMIRPNGQNLKKINSRNLGGVALASTILKTGLPVEIYLSRGKNLCGSQSL